LLTALNQHFLCMFAKAGYVALIVMAAGVLVWLIARMKWKGA